MIEKVSGQYGVEAAAKAKAKKFYPGAVKNVADEANFSTFAVELARVAGELKNVPEVRQDKIDDFKKLVDSGEYHPPLERIAHNLFLVGILNSED